MEIFRITHHRFAIGYREEQLESIVGPDSAEVETFTSPLEVTDSTP
jgi:hypothetical protein